MAISNPSPGDDVLVVAPSLSTGVIGLVPAKILEVRGDTGTARTIGYVPDDDLSLGPDADGNPGFGLVAVNFTAISGVGAVFATDAFTAKAAINAVLATADFTLAGAAYGDWLPITTSLAARIGGWIGTTLPTQRGYVPYTDLPGASRRSMELTVLDRAGGPVSYALHNAFQETPVIAGATDGSGTVQLIRRNFIEPVSTTRWTLEVTTYSLGAGGSHLRRAVLGRNTIPGVPLG